MSTAEDRAPKSDILKRIVAERLGLLEMQALELQAALIMRDQFIVQLKSQLQMAEGEIAELKKAKASELPASASYTTNQVGHQMAPWAKSAESS